jgi:hypothetical protein
MSLSKIIPVVLVILGIFILFMASSYDNYSLHTSLQTLGIVFFCIAWLVRLSSNITDGRAVVIVLLLIFTGVLSIIATDGLLEILKMLLSVF